jgi:hypothetical protein
MKSRRKGAKTRRFKTMIDAYDVLCAFAPLRRIVFHLVSSNNSRPISMRRISEVPAPIS